MCDSTWSLVSYPAPNSRAGKGLVTLERFLGYTGACMTSCQYYYAINHVPVPHCYAMQCKIIDLHSHWLVLNCQLTLYYCTVVAAGPDAKSHENRRAAIWLVFAKVRMLSLQEPRKRSLMSPNPFPSLMVESGNEITWSQDRVFEVTRYAISWNSLIKINGWPQMCRRST